MRTSSELVDVGIIPDWPAPRHVHCVSTLRTGGVNGGAGVSQGAYSSLNLGNHVGDDPAAVAANRAWLTKKIGREPCWLQQVHGVRTVDAAWWSGRPAPRADAAFTRQPGVICAVMTADCLPVLLCDVAGNVVAAVHAGWRGLVSGVLEAAVGAMEVPRERLLAWLGPAIGSQAFEVGAEVRSAFVAADAAAAQAFQPRSLLPGDSEKPDESHGCDESGATFDMHRHIVPNPRQDAPKYLADIYLLARQRLARLGVRHVFGGGLCTVNDAERFFSYRRDGATGRMATLIWLE